MTGCLPGGWPRRVQSRRRGSRRRFPLETACGRVHQHVAANGRHGHFPSVKAGAPLFLCCWSSPPCFRPQSRSLMTVKKVPHRCKQNVRPEGFEQMRAPTRDQANVLLWVTRHFDDRCATLYARTATSAPRPSGSTLSMSATSICDVRKIACASASVGTELTWYNVSSIVWTVHPRQSRPGNRAPSVPFYSGISLYMSSRSAAFGKNNSNPRRYFRRRHHRSFHVGFGTR
jgi:hypothetical protein